MTAGRYNITIEQGATFSLPILVADTISGSSVERNLTGYTARMKIKQFVTDTASLVELTTENGRITIDPDQVANTGEMSLALSATVTASLDFDQGVYDLELINGSVVERLLEGKVRLRREVTD
jgi:hypothetical protein